MDKIPFSKISFDQNEIKAVEKCFKSGWVVLGPKTKEFEEMFARYVGSKYAVFVDSGTSALFLSVYIEYQNNFVTIPSLTFCSDAEVLYHRNKKIRFTDVSISSLCVKNKEEELMPVNFGGNLTKHGGNVIDSCHRIERDDVKKYPNSLWCYSFYATKNMSTVQGGMIALNNKKKYETLLMLRDHGLTKGTQQRYEGKNPFYDILFPGFRVKGDDMRAVIGISQLKKLPKLTKQRNEIVARYNKILNLKRTGNHLYWVFVEDRKRFIDMMSEKNIQTSIHFLPLHKMTAYENESIELPITEYVGEHIVSIPMFPGMTKNQVDYVGKEVLKSGLLISL